MDQKVVEVSSLSLSLSLSISFSDSWERVRCKHDVPTCGKLLIMKLRKYQQKQAQKPEAQKHKPKHSPAARQAGHFTRGTASKLYRLAIVLEQGISGRVGYGGLMAIKARNWSSLCCCAPWSSAPTFFDIDMVSGSSTTLPQSWPWWEGALAIRG